MAAKNRRTFELRLGKLGLVLFVSGISVLLFSMFLLGIFVGKQMEAFPERYSAGMADMIYDRLFASAPQGSRVPPGPGAKGEPAGGEEGFGLTFYDTLSGKKGGVPKGKTAAAVKDKPSENLAPPPPASAMKPAIPEPLAASGEGTGGNRDLPVPAREGEEGKKAKPLPEKRAATEPGATAPAAMPIGTAANGAAIQEKGLFEVQVAAYQESRKAEQMMEKLHPLGFASRVVMKELPGKGKWYRVVVSGFENREKATAAADQIAGKIRGVKCVVRPAP